MHVDHLLQLESLDLTLLWGDAALLKQEISGVTATDLEDPARFLQPGEIVLSGLVWWSAEGGRAKADRFVSALRTSGAAALLAGEETHGEVPGHVLDACREQGIALLAVPARTNFRAITEAVYLRQWGDLSRRPSPHYLLPENVRHELSHLLAQDASPEELLDRAFAHLGDLPCYLVTATGRTIARTPAAPALPPHHLADSLRRDAGISLRVNSETSPYDTWYLHLPASEGPRPGCCTRSPTSSPSTTTTSTAPVRPPGRPPTSSSRCWTRPAPTPRGCAPRCAPAGCRSRAPSSSSPRR
ncbi:PucR family transcriptional regulator ligand-binding domain-containing protein [Streptomyces sp. RKAG293]|uniref:PucR family transcriptional regulator ligand-binding domain-containing protein n=1 Tax=Streptomyces sp. RKAG293 TaxID=2893403 RepID=UPI0027E5792A|nr:PucR family transcriptional regulator ligand-binding domain-containing protein [Streptomyces sp. RKAG293]